MNNNFNPAKRLLELILYTPKLFHCHSFSNGHLIKKSKYFHSLSPIQLRTLIFLNRKKQVNLKEVANFLGVTPPTASVLIDSLVKKFLVKRLSSPTKGDRRLIIITITNKGKKQASDLTVLMNEKINQFFQPLTKQEKETLCLLLEKSLLNKINN